MNFRFLSPAEQELDDAYLWYEDQMPRLGREFLVEFDEAVHRITTWPQAHTVFERCFASVSCSTISLWTDLRC